eukprot:jgi/Mesvir1/1555/Mv14534-RA.3
MCDLFESHLHAFIQTDKPKLVLIIHARMFLVARLPGNLAYSQLELTVVILADAPPTDITTDASTVPAEATGAACLNTRHLSVPPASHGLRDASGVATATSIPPPDPEPGASCQNGRDHPSDIHHGGAAVAAPVLGTLLPVASGVHENVSKSASEASAAAWDRHDFPCRAPPLLLARVTAQHSMVAGDGMRTAWRMLERVIFAMADTLLLPPISISPSSTTGLGPTSNGSEGNDGSRIHPGSQAIHGAPVTGTMGPSSMGRRPAQLPAPWGHGPWELGQQELGTPTELLSPALLPFFGSKLVSGVRGTGLSTDNATTIGGLCFPQAGGAKGRVADIFAGMDDDDDEDDEGGNDGSAHLVNGLPGQPGTPAFAPGGGQQVAADNTPLGMPGVHQRSAQSPWGFSDEERARAVLVLFQVISFCVERASGAATQPPMGSCPRVMTLAQSGRGVDPCGEDVPASIQHSCNLSSSAPPCPREALEALSAAYRTSLGPCLRQLTLLALDGLVACGSLEVAMGVAEEVLGSPCFAPLRGWLAGEVGLHEMARGLLVSISNKMVASSDPTGQHASSSAHSQDTEPQDGAGLGGLVVFGRGHRRAAAKSLASVAAAATATTMAAASGRASSTNVTSGAPGMGRGRGRWAPLVPAEGMGRGWGAAGASSSLGRSGPVSGGVGGVVGLGVPKEGMGGADAGSMELSPTRLAKQVLPAAIVAPAVALQRLVTDAIYHKGQTSLLSFLLQQLHPLTGSRATPALSLGTATRWPLPCHPEEAGRTVPEDASSREWQIKAASTSPVESTTPSMILTSKWATPGLPAGVSAAGEHPVRQPFLSEPVSQYSGGSTFAPHGPSPATSSSRPPLILVDVIGTLMDDSAQELAGAPGAVANLVHIVTALLAPEHAGARSADSTRGSERDGGEGTGTGRLAGAPEDTSMGLMPGGSQGIVNRCAQGAPWPDGDQQGLHLSSRRAALARGLLERCILPHLRTDMPEEVDPVAVLQLLRCLLHACRCHHPQRHATNKPASVPPASGTTRLPTSTSPLPASGLEAHRGPILLAPVAHMSDAKWWARQPPCETAHTDPTKPPQCAAISPQVPHALSSQQDPLQPTPAVRPSPDSLGAGGAEPLHWGGERNGQGPCDGCQLWGSLLSSDLLSLCVGLCQMLECRPYPELEVTEAWEEGEGVVPGHGVRAAVSGPNTRATEAPFRGCDMQACGAEALSVQAGSPLAAGVQSITSDMKDVCAVGKIGRNGSASAAVAVGENPGKVLLADGSSALPLAPGSIGVLQTWRAPLDKLPGEAPLPAQATDLARMAVEDLVCLLADAPSTGSPCGQAEGASHDCDDCSTLVSILGAAGQSLSWRTQQYLASLLPNRMLWPPSRPGKLAAGCGMGAGSLPRSSATGDDGCLLMSDNGPARSASPRYAPRSSPKSAGDAISNTDAGPKQETKGPLSCAVQKPSSEDLAACAWEDGRGSSTAGCPSHHAEAPLPCLATKPCKAAGLDLPAFLAYLQTLCRQGPGPMRPPATHHRRVDVSLLAACCELAWLASLSRPFADQVADASWRVYSNSCGDNSHDSSAVCDASAMTMPGRARLLEQEGGGKPGGRQGPSHMAGTLVLEPIAGPTGLASRLVGLILAPLCRPAARRCLLVACARVLPRVTVAEGQRLLQVALPPLLLASDALLRSAPTPPRRAEGTSPFSNALPFDCKPCRDVACAALMLDFVPRVLWLLAMSRAEKGHPCQVALGQLVPLRSPSSAPSSSSSPRDGASLSAPGSDVDPVAEAAAEALVRQLSQLISDGLTASSSRTGVQSHGEAGSVRVCGDGGGGLAIGTDEREMGGDGCCSDRDKGGHTCARQLYTLLALQAGCDMLHSLYPVFQCDKALILCLTVMDSLVPKFEPGASGLPTTSSKRATKDKHPRQPASQGAASALLTTPAAAGQALSSSSLRAPGRDSCSCCCHGQGCKGFIPSNVMGSGLLSAGADRVEWAREHVQTVVPAPLQATLLSVLGKVAERLEPQK